MRKAPAFQFYADDFLAGTFGMTDAEKGVYITLLCVQWSKGGVSDREAKMAGEKQAVEYVLGEKFQREVDGKYRNARLERVREIQEERSKAGANGGKRSLSGKDGYVYAMRRESDGAVKLGASAYPAKRRSQHAGQQGCEVETLHVWKVANMEAAEKYLHAKFHLSQIEGEWFDLKNADLSKVGSELVASGFAAESQRTGSGRSADGSAEPQPPSPSPTPSSSPNSSSSTPQTPQGAPCTVQEFFDRWNRFAGKTPKVTACRKLTEKRREKIRKRLDDDGWFDDFREAILNLPLGGDGWQPNLDWMIRNDHNIYLLMEGAFDWRCKDDPAMQRLAATRRKKAYEQRQAYEQKKQADQRQAAAGTQKAIDNILRPTGGDDASSSDHSLLFGSDGDSSASGADRSTRSGDSETNTSATCSRDGSQE